MSRPARHLKCHLAYRIAEAAIETESRPSGLAVCLVCSGQCLGPALGLFRTVPWTGSWFVQDSALDRLDFVLLGCLVVIAISSMAYQLDVDVKNDGSTGLRACCMPLHVPAICCCMQSHAATYRCVLYRYSSLGEDGFLGGSRFIMTWKYIIYSLTGVSLGASAMAVVREIHYKMLKDRVELLFLVTHMPRHAMPRNATSCDASRHAIPRHGACAATGGYRSGKAARTLDAATDVSDGGELGL